MDTMMVAGYQKKKITVLDINNPVGITILPANSGILKVIFNGQGAANTVAVTIGGVTVALPLVFGYPVVLDTESLMIEFDQQIQFGAFIGSVVIEQYI